MTTTDEKWVERIRQWRARTAWRGWFSAARSWQAIAWVERHLSDVRPGVVVPPDHGVLFLTASGEELSPNRLTQPVRDYVNAANTGKKGACHLFRHTIIEDGRAGRVTDFDEFLDELDAQP